MGKNNFLDAEVLQKYENEHIEIAIFKNIDATCHPRRTYWADVSGFI